ARDMRKDPTLAERILWSELRRGRLGVRFRRQEPAGPFIPDFACLTRKLIIELDGGAHEDIPADLERDRWFHDRGWFVLRFNNDEILDNLDESIALIQKALDDPSSVDDPQNLRSFSPAERRGWSEVRGTGGASSAV
ncbi:MAG: DUF559 domain-containing protein, partial [Actinomycetota bacterium]|nr:DUF559 domain-containing protein [Actinomycetota bacterium]